MLYQRILKHNSHSHKLIFSTPGWKMCRWYHVRQILHWVFSMLHGQILEDRCHLLKWCWFKGPLQEPVLGFSILGCCRNIAVQHGGLFTLLYETDLCCPPSWNTVTFILFGAPVSASVLWSSLKWTLFRPDSLLPPPPSSSSPPCSHLLPASPLVTAFSAARHHIHTNSSLPLWRG